MKHSIYCPARNNKVCNCGVSDDEHEASQVKLVEAIADADKLRKALEKIKELTKDKLRWYVILKAIVDNNGVGSTPRDILTSHVDEILEITTKVLEVGKDEKTE